MTIITENCDRFEVFRRDKTSGHIPQVDVLSIERIIEMYATNEHISVYKAHHQRLTLFELAEINLKRLEVHTKEHIWQEFMKKEGSHLANTVYDILRDSIESSDTLKRVNAVLTPQGKVVRATEGVDIPEDMAFPSHMFIELAMGDYAALTNLYHQIDEDDGAFMYTQELVPYTVWASILGAIGALAGYPYSLYMSKEPYHADFWTQAKLQMPDIYNSMAQRQFSRMEDIHKALLASNMTIVNHKEVANERATTIPAG